MTSQNPEKRWGNNGKNYIGCDKFMKAIIKYGWDNFEHEIFENNLTKEEAELLESELILNYKTTDDEFGYNLQSGGNSPTFSEDTKRKMSISVLCVETEQQFYGAAEASVKTGIHFSNINKCCRGQAHTAGGYHWKYADKDKQEEFEKEMRELELNNPIQKIICIETGQIYNSITEAASLLRNCCKGLYKTAGKEKKHFQYYYDYCMENKEKVLYENIN